jgi:hypothetical protein
VELLHQHFPDAIVAKDLASAKPGEYVVSKNGWVVPLIYSTILVQCFYQYKGKRKYRKTKFYSNVYHFPKQRVCVRQEKVCNYVFNYIPKSNKNISGEDKRNRMYELSVRKLEWANYVINGIDPSIATNMVYKNLFNKNKMTKTLLLNSKLMDYIYFRKKQRLIDLGISKEQFVKILLNMINEPQKNIRIRSNAVEILYKLIGKDLLCFD